MRPFATDCTAQCAAFEGALPAATARPSLHIGFGHLRALRCQQGRRRVPARNMVMIAAACAVADADGYTDIVTGTNLEEAGAYPDNTQAFIATMDAASQLGTTSRAHVHAPLGNLVKHQIVATGLGVGAPLEATWSCYRNGDVHCGTCGPCFVRRVAFEINDVTDPVPHAAPLLRLRPAGRGATSRQEHASAQQYGSGVDANPERRVGLATQVLALAVLPLAVEPVRRHVRVAVGRAFMDVCLVSLSATRSLPGAAIHIHALSSTFPRVGCRSTFSRPSSPAS